MELDTTKVANAYMRSLEEQVRSLIVANALLQAKLNVAMEEIELIKTTVNEGHPVECVDFCPTPKKCSCIKKSEK